MSNGAPPTGPGQSGTGYSSQSAAAPAPASTTGNAAGTSSSTTTSSNQNLNQIVTDYLIKRGYTRTEAEFRKEIANVDINGRHIPANEDTGARKYIRAFKHLEKWVEDSLDIYKFELGKLLWPIFVYSYLDLVSSGYVRDAKEYMEKLRASFENVHGEDIKRLAVVTLPQHVQENEMAKLYRENKYTIPLNQYAAGNLFSWMEKTKDEGGDTIIFLINQYCNIEVVNRGPIEPFSFEAIYRRARNVELDEVDAQEGIPGAVSKTGVSNRELLDFNAAALKLGPLPLDPELRVDILAELEEEDKNHPPRDGTRTLVDEFNLMHPIKREAGDSPQRTDIPYPPSRSRDIIMEMQKVRENRDRFKIEGRTGGVGPGVSVCMFTIHNSLGSMDFSKDQKLVAVGTTDSYIRIWSLDGKPLKSSLPAEKDLKVNNRKLIGHSGPVYSVHFSDAIIHPDRQGSEHPESQPETDAKLLISSSADGQIRLWSLESWSCLCIYKGHDGPVMSVAWGPHGHYFASGGWDKIVRVWSQDHTSSQRLLVGHDTAISALTWHPNGTYVFSASDEADKSIRMWSIATGNCVRIFHGHTEYISALECAPNGKILASADVGGNIFLWDIAKASRIKRCRGHGRGGIWSLSFSVESNTLVSGGQDNTVRVWDVEMPAEGTRTTTQADGGDGTIVAAGTGAGAEGKASGTGTTNTATGTGSTTGGTGKKKGKEVMITPDQISAFLTKRTPVMKVQFTRMNLVIAGGCYDPEQR